MTRSRFFGAAVAAVVIAAWPFSQRSHDSETPFEPPSRLVELAPLCPWRDPDGDLKRFFPGANRWQTETRILSGQRSKLEKQLGRPPAADENALNMHRVYRGPEFVGSVLTRRAKGEHGAMEIVLAITSDQAIKGIRLQRLREPPDVALALASEAWLGAFAGTALGADWDVKNRLPSVPIHAGMSAAAVVDAVRSLLVLLAAAEDAGTAGPAGHHH